MDVYTWIAEYHDGTSVAERDVQGDHGWADVDPAKVKYIHLVNLAGITVFSAAIPPDVTCEVFRRRTITLDTGSGEETSRASVTCVGWPGAYFWLTDDGMTALTAAKD